MTHVHDVVVEFSGGDQRKLEPNAREVYGAISRKVVHMPPGSAPGMRIRMRRKSQEKDNEEEEIEKRRWRKVVKKERNIRWKLRSKKDIG